MIKQKTLKNINLKSDEEGFSHLIILLSVLVIVAISSVAYEVASHHKSTTQASLNQTKTSANRESNKLSPSSAQTSTLSTATSSPSSTSPSTTTSSTKSSTASSNRTTTGTSSPSAATSNSSPVSATSPLSVLTSIIAGLDNGSQSAQVTVSNVTIPGPIRDATGRPIVFSINGKQYFAYSQSSAPNFNQSASATAGTMAIIPATVSITSFSQTHLDKANNLVDENSSGLNVGYSSGGN
jgi:cytoskeletal protein RodZ